MFRRRTMPRQGHIPRTVAPGGAVTITAAGCGGLGTVTETLPAGLGRASSDLDDAEVQATGQQVRFPLQGDSPSMYIVTARNIFGSTADTRVAITVSSAILGSLASKYDVDNNEAIDRDEVLAAIADYFRGSISLEQVLEVIKLYFAI